MPARRKVDNKLFQALLTEQWKPWRSWIQKAEARNCNLLVSHEALSRSLHQVGTDFSTPRGVWLARKLRRCGWDLKVISFIRDQESYLNSRYTQLVKRLKISSDFDTYVENVIQGNTISECDMITLFGWLIGRRKIKRVMIPFQASKDQTGQEHHTQPDPFQQLVNELLLPEEIIAHCKYTRSHNQQPGRLGVALALEINEFLTQHQPEVLKNHWKQLQLSIERLAETQDWATDPFNGLNKTIQQTIRNRYEASNAEFCRCFWPGMTWHELFNSRRQDTDGTSTSCLEVADADLKPWRWEVLADILPPNMMNELPG